MGQNSQLLAGKREKVEAMLLVSATYLHKMSHKTHRDRAAKAEFHSHQHGISRHLAVMLLCKRANCFSLGEKKEKRKNKKT